jgi:flagellar protein FliO/FliZ
MTSIFGLLRYASSLGIGFISSFLYAEIHPMKIPHSTHLSHSTIPSENILPMLGGLLLILVFIFIVAWLSKRVTRWTQKNPQIKVIENYSIGNKEKLVIILVENKRILIGVTPYSIKTISILDDNDNQIPQDPEKKTKKSKNEALNENSSSFIHVINEMMKPSRKHHS